ncbi:MAG TPA: carboxypeptidase regulatory-like domain-containing protein [Vicinamibacterales bacterium]|nr:carboxypeptidase regulatory-like domain-containing protein [Vicinamibacterales bacterium]
MGRVHVASVFLFAALVLAAPLAAQQGTAQIKGKVTDAQGAVLPGVSVLVKNEETGAERDLTSSVEGSYSAAQLTPGRYSVTAKLAGFRTMERNHLVLLVGTTLTIDLSLPVGGVEESVTVTGQSPLVDTTTATVGGNVGTAELSELPAMNRNYFSAVALLPGVQFSPSNQMGNDTIVANGQTSQNTNVSVDGGYNADDALGTSSGAQVRTPLEAVQEFQVLTSMYDAEFGRASGAIVNAVSKSGTNQLRGVVFGYGASNALTAEDYFVKRNNLEKPTTTKREWGGVVGGPIIKNKLHFFGSLERQVDNPNRSHVFETRPDQNFAIAEDRTDWNTMIRIDHQISQSHSWAVRWLREWAPQWNTIGARNTPDSAQDETDLDQTAVGTLTSVIGNTRVNTARIARTWEHWWHGNACFRAQGSNSDQAGFKFGEEAAGQQKLCAPQLNYTSFLGQASTESQGPWDSNYQIEDDFSWFIPGKKGDHEVKFGARYNYTELRRVSQINENGTFTINNDLAFNAADPRTYPERLSIRMGTFNELIENHTVELYAQDKWKLGDRTTLSVGARYDLEIIPLDETDNPLFGGSNKYPVDRNNIAPRIGFSHSFDERGRSVLRGGYGMFYNRTILGAIDDVLEQSKYTSSNVVNFPNASADPGPSAGRFPTDPMLVNGPFVNRALLEQLFPPNTRIKNAGVVVLDAPERQQPFAHQATLGFGRELTPTIAINADFVHTANRDMFLARNLNPKVRANTTRTGAITRVNAFGVLDEAYTENVWVMENTGYNDYDALNISLEKRFADGWSGRVSYSLSKSFGTAENQADKNTYQTLTELNLDQWEAPSSVDRRHILALNGRMDVPKTHGATLAATFRYMTGAPFTILNSNIDADRNGELTDPSPAGTYSGTAPGAAVLTNVTNKGGRNGAIGPDYLQLDLRAGWRAHLRGSQAVEMFLDIFNVTNRANFDNPSGDERTNSTFLVLTNLRGGGGFPRQAQLGVRYTF